MHMLYVCGTIDIAEYLGCFVDGYSDRVLPSYAYLTKLNTIEACINSCLRRNRYTYAGVEVSLVSRRQFDASNVR